METANPGQGDDLADAVLLPAVTALDRIRPHHGHLLARPVPVTSATSPKLCDFPLAPNAGWITAQTPAVDGGYSVCGLSTGAGPPGFRATGPRGICLQRISGRRRVFPDRSSSDRESRPGSVRSGRHSVTTTLPMVFRPASRAQADWTSANPTVSLITGRNAPLW